VDASGLTERLLLGSRHIAWREIRSVQVSNLEIWGAWAVTVTDVAGFQTSLGATRVASGSRRNRAELAKIVEAIRATMPAGSVQHG
jgi:hypothetical protein